jgi:hypothetical protein
MRKVLFAIALLLPALGTAGVALADPNLSDVRAHRHFIQKGDELVQVGPRVCDNPALQHAFNQFHANLHSHAGVTGEIGPLAPGLHNEQDPEITSGDC